jgi:hypothetical protein
MPLPEEVKRKLAAIRRCLVKRSEPPLSPAEFLARLNGKDANWREKQCALEKEARKLARECGFRMWTVGGIVYHYTLRDYATRKIIAGKDCPLDPSEVIEYCRGILGHEQLHCDNGDENP